MLNYKIFRSKEDTASALADEVFHLLGKNKNKKYTIALSGGSTPFLMFDALVANYGKIIDWKKVHFFWVDERCVAPQNEESNFGNTQKTLFNKIEIPESNIHRVRGEDNPQDEADRYAAEIMEHVAFENEIPQFDLVLLGMGDDGHTASIFPPQIGLIHANSFVAVGQNPYSNQNRITLTGGVINNAKQIRFLVTGKSKAAIFAQILYQNNNYLKYPSAHIESNPQQTLWYLDKEATELL